MSSVSLLRSRPNRNRSYGPLAKAVDGSTYQAMSVGEAVSASSGRRQQHYGEQYQSDQAQRPGGDAVQAGDKAEAGQHQGRRTHGQYLPRVQRHDSLVVL